MFEKQKAELQFWQDLYNQLGDKDFNKLREEDLKEKTKHFVGLFEEKGNGLDIGCGLKSIFEYSKLKIKAVDPLLEEYKKITEIKDTENINYETADCEKMPFKNKFDFAVCINVLDHTPNPEKLLKEVKRLVKKGGKFYFQVNFDDYLAKQHYFLLTEKSLLELMKEFKEISSVIERNEKDRQIIFNAIYEV